MSDTLTRTQEIALLVQRAASSPLTQPINLFNIGPYVGEILADCESIVASVKQLLVDSSLLLQNDTTLENNQADISQQIEALQQTIATLATAISDTTNLLMVTIQGLGNVATENLQQQEITLLTEIWRAVSNQPVAQGVDFTRVWATANPHPPVKSGP